MLLPPFAANTKTCPPPPQNPVHPQVVNYNHMMPTRYTLDVDLKGVVSGEVVDDSSKKTDANKVGRGREGEGREGGSCRTAPLASRRMSAVWELQVAAANHTAPRAEGRQQGPGRGVGACLSQQGTALCVASMVGMCACASSLVVSLLCVSQCMWTNSFLHPLPAPATGRPHLQEAKKLFEEKFKSGKNRWFFTKLRF